MAGAKYFPPAVRGTFSSPKTGPTRFPSDGKSLARCKPPSENDEMEFSFSKRLFLSFFSFVSFFFIFHFARSSERRAHVAAHQPMPIAYPLLPSPSTRNSWTLPPLQWPLPVRPSGLQRAWNDQKVTHKAIRGGNTTSGEARRGEEAITRRIVYFVFVETTDFQVEGRGIVSINEENRR